MVENTDATPVRWIHVCTVSDVPDDGGVCIKHGDLQIALFHFTRRKEWYASQNMCPHRKQMALSRGMMGSAAGEPKVACPFHKKTFSLEDGRCLNSDEGYRINVYPVRIDGENVYIQLPVEEIQSAHLCSTHVHD